MDKKFWAGIRRGVVPKGISGMYVLTGYVEFHRLSPLRSLDFFLLPLVWTQHLLWRASAKTDKHCIEWSIALALGCIQHGRQDKTARWKQGSLEWMHEYRPVAVGSPWDRRNCHVLGYTWGWKSSSSTMYQCTFDEARTGLHFGACHICWNGVYSPSPTSNASRVSRSKSTQFTKINLTCLRYLSAQNL